MKSPKKYERTPLTPKILEKFGITGIHPAADLFPLMSDDEFQALCADVKKQGFVHRVKVDKDNVVIDGRNRLQVSWALELDVDLERINPSDPLATYLQQDQ